MAERLLEVKDLSTQFFTHAGVVKAVNGVSFTLDRNETIGIVGESGSGKTVAALSLMRLIPDPPGRVVEGSLMLGDRDLRTLSDDEMRGVRGNDIAMIFQDPMTSLNPVMKIGKQIGEAITLHQDKSKREAWKMAVDLLARVGIPDAPEARRSVPVRVLRRHAAARHDRHGHQLQPGHPHRRRAHHGARRHDPGADHRRGARDAGAVQLRRHPHHPRPRRDRRDRRQGDGHVRRPHRRVRLGGRDLLQLRIIRTRGGCWPRCRASMLPRRSGSRRSRGSRRTSSPCRTGARSPPAARIGAPSAATTGRSSRSSVPSTASTAGSPRTSARELRVELPAFQGVRGMSLLEVARPQEALPDPHRRAQAHDRLGVRRGRRELRRREGRDDRVLSGRAAAASPPSAAPSCVSPRRPAVR